DPSRHLRVGETVPQDANTKQRLERVVEDAVPRSKNERLRKPTRTAIELAQKLTHSSIPSRTDPVVAAHSLMLYGNIVRRIRPHRVQDGAAEAGPVTQPGGSPDPGATRRAGGAGEHRRGQAAARSGGGRRGGRPVLRVLRRGGRQGLRDQHPARTLDARL